MVPQEAASNHFTVDISKAGRVTTATVEGMGLVGVGSAIRQEADKDNPTIGTELAVGRAIRDLGKRLVKDAWKLDRYVWRAER